MSFVQKINSASHHEKIHSSKLLSIWSPLKLPPGSKIQRERGKENAIRIKKWSRECSARSWQQHGMDGKMCAREIESFDVIHPTKGNFVYSNNTSSHLKFEPTPDWKTENTADTQKEGERDRGQGKVHVCGTERERASERQPFYDCRWQAHALSGVGGERGNAEAQREESVALESGCKCRGYTREFQPSGRHARLLVGCGRKCDVAQKIPSRVM